MTSPHDNGKSAADGAGPAAAGRGIAVLVTSAGRRVGLIEAFRRGAADLSLPITIVACDREPDWSAGCQIADHAHAVPPVDAPGYIDALIAICRAHDVRLVVPTIDPELLPIARARDRFAAVGAAVSVGAPALVAMARDKLATADFLDRIGVPAPATVALDTLRADPAALDWPVMVKPRHGSASRALSTAADPSQIDGQDPEPMIAQRLLSGTEWTVNLFFDQGGALHAVVPHRRVQVRAGEVEKGVTERHAALCDIARTIARNLPGPRGALCFQAMIDADGRVGVFEINARFGGGYPLADRAGARFARWLLEEASGAEATARDDWVEGMTMLRYDAAVYVHPCA